MSRYLRFWPHRDTTIPNEVYPIEDAKRIGFTLRVEQKRCVPINPDRARGDVKGDTKSQVKRIVYLTLEQCNQTIPVDVTSIDLPSEIERLIGSYFVNSEDYQTSYGARMNYKGQLPLVQTDVAESRDVLTYYMSGRKDVALSLLRLGYGIDHLRDLMRHIFNDSGKMMIDAIDYDIYSLIVNNPTWVQGIDELTRANMWLWGVDNLILLLEEKQITPDQLMEGTALLSRNVFPLSTYDLKSRIWTIVSGIERLNPLARPILEQMINTFVSRVANNKRQLAELTDWFISKTERMCREAYFARDDILANILLDLPVTQSIPEMKRLRLEREMIRLYNSMDAPGTDTSSSDVKDTVAKIEALISQGVGRCFNPRNTNRIELQKRIVYPGVRDYKRASRQNISSLPRNQLQTLLVDSNEQDIKELSNVLSNLDIDNLGDESLIRSLTSKCRSGDLRLSVGCAGIESLLADLNSRLPIDSGGDEEDGDDDGEGDDDDVEGDGEGDDGGDLEGDAEGDVDYEGDE